MRNHFNNQTSDQPSKRGYSVDEVSVMYGLSRQKVYDEIHSGRLKSFKVGVRRVIPTTALADWENGGEAALPRRCIGGRP
ncbi:MAG TPA: helix-turn-helix domain-containing protein [Gammaproteobacteria bacterium]|nr:helix-turn-helix domain-containing protein [Gammaproteobacteria bacterium]